MGADASGSCGLPAASTPLYPSRIMLYHNSGLEKAGERGRGRALAGRAPTQSLPQALTSGGVAPPVTTVQRPGQGLACPAPSPAPCGPSGA